ESDAAEAEVVVALLGEALHRSERQRELLRDHLGLRLGVAYRACERLVIGALLLGVGGSGGHRCAPRSVDADLLARRSDRRARQGKRRDARECKRSEHSGSLRRGWWR